MLALYHFSVVFKKKILTLWFMFSLNNSLSVLNKLRNDKVLLFVNVLSRLVCFSLALRVNLVETIFSMKK